MNIIEQTVMAFDFRPEEKEALLTTYKILLDINLKWCNKYSMLSSFATGEIIEIDELPKVRGIISAILDNNAWVME